MSWKQLKQDRIAICAAYPQIYIVSSRQNPIDDAPIKCTWGSSRVNWLGGFSGVTVGAKDRKFTSARPISVSSLWKHPSTATSSQGHLV